MHVVVEVLAGLGHSGLGTGTLSGDAARLRADHSSHIHGASHHDVALHRAAVIHPVSVSVVELGGVVVIKVGIRLLGANKTSNISINTSGPSVPLSGLLTITRGISRMLGVS